MKKRSLTIVILLVLGAVGMMFWVGGHDVVSGRITPGELADVCLGQTWMGKAQMPRD